MLRAFHCIMWFPESDLYNIVGHEEESFTLYSGSSRVVFTFYMLALKSCKVYIALRYTVSAVRCFSHYSGVCKVLHIMLRL